MNMGEQQRPRLEALAKGIQQRRQAGARPGIDQHIIDLPATDHALAAEVHEINHAHG
jgi:hypothetical protein